MLREMRQLAANCVAASVVFTCVFLVTTHSSAQIQLSPNALAIYVSPAGNDTWSGKLPEPNAQGTDGPLATVTGARDRVRTLKTEAAGRLTPITVILRGGVYRQPETVVFTPADSGTKAAPITYQAWPGETPVISGGTTVTGWQRDKGPHSKAHCGGKLWRLAVRKSTDGRRLAFNQLFVNGKRRTRARIPNRGAFLRTDGPTSSSSSRSFFFNEGDVKRWDNLRDVIFVLYHSWETSIHHIRSVDTESRRVVLREPAPWPMGRWEKRQRYYVENVFEGLDEPGEWYLDRRAGVLYYYPLPGEKMDRIEVVVPTVVSTLIRLQGNPAKGEFIDGLHFKDVAFRHTNAELDRIRNPGQGEIYQPALIMATGLRNSSFEACEVAHTGAHAIWMAEGCTDNRIGQCHLYDLNGGGVYIGGGWGIHEKHPAERITVDNCFIHEGGHLFHGAHGVWIGKSSYNQITHNEISNFDYSGISCGWSWGFHPTSAHDNILDYNYIHHLSNGEGLSDMGGIYTLGLSPGTTERYNHIHDVYNYAGTSHGSGIYPDEGSTDILIENNVVYRVRTCPLFMHYGKECIVRNNVLAYGGKGQMRRSREDKRCHYRATGNIVFGGIKKMLDGPWKSGDWEVARNVYWSTAGEPDFAGMDLAAWQAKGNDVGSIVADPLFADPENGDFNLSANSPALTLGFKPIDLSDTGLYGDDDWVNLPSQYANRPLNEIPPPVNPPFLANFDFEGAEVNEQPLDGKVITYGKGTSLVVSADTAASGTQSLKFADIPGQKYTWAPHIYYNPSYETGKVQLSWDMLNSKDTPASFYVEVRQYGAAHPYLVGPTVSVTPDGAVTASEQAIGTIPLGEWVHVDIAIELGKNTPKTYLLTLTVPNRTPTTVEVPYAAEAFEQITWLGISSTSDAKTVFYIDNLKLGTSKELSQPPARRPRSRRRKKTILQPPNKELLVGHWTFSDSDDYTADDRSGCENAGELWAKWAKGSFGTAVFCDAGASHVSIPDAPTLQFGTSDLSIDLWICPTQLSIDETDARRRVLGKNAHPQTWWNLDITAAGQPYLEMADQNKVSGTTKPKGTIRENVWTHLVVVVDRANGKTSYYINGKLDSALTIPAAFKGPLDVGGRDLTLGSTWHPFIGLIDEVRIYKRAITADEVEASYNKEKGNRTSTEYELLD
ncbi:MAG: hypothetical protein HN742_14435 [Lentisphaerae bacterium]|jgi:hypothetical protein|nr:hypothetical protein [Lentisphaerota bacterium]MBT5606850.1 hypothetical protein [Lentisphaerota bacterium]MBT7055292.1 hypothetical protein [Lentisphaerota bacterium]MBT7843073.1 hypothetical protein [Lentisphaerota bacterium]